MFSETTAKGNDISTRSHDTEASVRIPREKHKLSWITESPVYQFAKNVRELLLLVVFLLTVVAFPFKKPTLQIRYSLDRLYPPIGVESRIEEKAKGSGDANDILSSLSALVRSRDLLRVNILNNSTNTIKDLELHIDGFTIADVALHSNSSSIMADRKKLAVFEISDNFVSRFPNFTSIPSKGKVEMLLWGNSDAFFWGVPVQLHSTTASVEVIREGTASGLGLFIASNLLVLTIFLAVGLLLLGLRRYKWTPSRRSIS